MTKIPIYFMPGLGAGPEIFDNLDLSSEIYDLFYLKWKQPLSLEESLEDYTKRMSKNIHHKNPVLIGVSFGGIIMQELSKIINSKKVIIISSIKTKNELPLTYNTLTKSKLYKLFPTKIVSNIENYSKFFIGSTLKKKAKIYKKYFSVRDQNYIKWSIHAVLHWQHDNILTNIIHIHGTKDAVFPITNISQVIKIEGGTHAMILTKAKKISKIIHQTLTC
jgi:pimeloyl-ACP methyl ester carboxylesterase